MTHITLNEVKESESKTDWRRVQAMSDEDITRAAESDQDALPLDDPFFATARRLLPQTLLKENKQQITLRIDADVLAWFRTLGSGYQSRMNAVLKAYVETHIGYDG
jgi:uncharacterized protein (DUF4415 family)